MEAELIATAASFPTTAWAAADGSRGSLMCPCSIGSSIATVVATPAEAGCSVQSISSRKDNSDVFECFQIQQLRVASNRRLDMTHDSRQREKRQMNFDIIYLFENVEAVACV